MVRSLNGFVAIRFLEHIWVKQPFYRTCLRIVLEGSYYPNTDETVEESDKTKIEPYVKGPCLAHHIRV